MKRILIVICCFLTVFVMSCASKRGDISAIDKNEKFGELQGQVVYFLKPKLTFRFPENEQPNENVKTNLREILVYNVRDNLSSIYAHTIKLAEKDLETEMGFEAEFNFLRQSANMLDIYYNVFFTFQNKRIFSLLSKQIKYSDSRILIEPDINNITNYSDLFSECLIKKTFDNLKYSETAFRNEIDVYKEYGFLEKRKFVKELDAESIHNMQINIINLIENNEIESDFSIEFKKLKLLIENIREYPDDYVPIKIFYSYMEKLMAMLSRNNAAIALQNAALLGDFVLRTPNSPSDGSYNVGISGVGLICKDRYIHKSLQKYDQKLDILFEAEFHSPKEIRIKRCLNFKNVQASRFETFLRKNPEKLRFEK